MIISDVQHLIQTFEELQNNIPTLTPMKFPSQRPEEEEGITGFVKRHKKKLLAGAALAGTIYAAKHGKLPQPLQLTADSATLTGSALATDAANRIRQATGQTTIGDIFTKRETIKGYLKNKARNIANVMLEPHT